MNKAIKRRAMAIATAAREELQTRGTVFSNTADYRPLLEERLRVMQSEAYDGFVDLILKDVDDAAHKAATVCQQADLPGMSFSLGGELRLGDDQRVAQRFARLHHAETALAIDKKNLDAVQAAHERKQQELEALRPYWKLRMTKTQAVAAYQQANPNTGVA